MTCEPYCEMCGGNLGHPANGDWICSKCKGINEHLAPKPPLGPSDQFIRRGHNPDMMPPLRFEPTPKRLGDVVI